MEVLFRKEHENVNGNDSTQCKSWKGQFIVLQNVIWDRLSVLLEAKVMYEFRAFKDVSEIYIFDFTENVREMQSLLTIFMTVTI
jgi:hypothetical protein